MTEPYKPYKVRQFGVVTTATGPPDAARTSRGGDLLIRWAAVELGGKVALHGRGDRGDNLLDRCGGERSTLMM